MPPAVTETSLLSRQGYSVDKAALGPGALAAARKELTMVPLQTGGMPTPGADAEFRLYRESARRLYVPRAFGLERWGLPHACTLPPGEPLSPGVAFVGELRPEQLPAVRAFLEAARDPLRLGGILALPCGFGKTIAALHLVAALGVRTMILMHKTFLIDQWRERIAQFLPAASVGLVRAGVLDVAGRDVVLASVQSLSMKEYPEGAFEGFGLLIVDECHRVGTEVFSRALHRAHFRHALGLSATVQRKDGMTKAFLAFLGQVLYEGRRPPEAVRVVQRRFEPDDGDPRTAGYAREEVIPSLGKPNISRMINNIGAHAPRTAAIAQAIHAALVAEPGRRVLVLSDRKAQLAALGEALGGLGVERGFYWGGMKPAELARSEAQPVMLATYSFAAEGMDVPGLDTLVLASPKTDVEQACGRILRQRAEARARTPLVHDWVDAFHPIFEAQAAKRRAFYRRQGYVVVVAVGGGAQ